MRRKVCRSLDLLAEIGNDNVAGTPRSVRELGLALALQPSSIQVRINEMRALGWLVAAEAGAPHRALKVTAPGWAALKETIEGRRCVSCGAEVLPPVSGALGALCRS